MFQMLKLPQIMLALKVRMCRSVDPFIKVSRMCGCHGLSEYDKGTMIYPPAQHTAMHGDYECVFSAVTHPTVDMS